MSRNGIFRQKNNASVRPPDTHGGAAAGSVSAAALAAVFDRCADYSTRSVAPGVTLCWLDPLVSAARLAEDVLRPLSRAAAEADGRALLERVCAGGVWAGALQRRDMTDETAADVLSGCCALVFDALGVAVTAEVRSETVRGVDQPAVEKSVKGGKDAFVEVLRTNVGLVRRRLRTPALKTEETVVGRRGRTCVTLCWLDGVADAAVAAELRRRLDAVDVDALLAAGGVEQYLTDAPRSPFPQLLHTERPDKFAAELAAGRVGLLADGLPVGFLAPADLTRFFRVAEDAAQHFLVATGLTLLRWGAALVSAFLPALLAAVCMYHPEMIPTKLLLSMIEAKQQVPFSVAFEMLTMLAAFELLMEAGVRLPDPVGDTDSIIGALIVGQSAVEARIVSPFSVIVVAAAAICGFTQPSRDLGAALRLCRFALLFLAIALGLYGVMLGAAALGWYLCTIESFGRAYTGALTEGTVREKLLCFLRPPLPAEKLRERGLRTPDRRRQR